MAKKQEAGIRSFDDLNIILQNSFSGIKQDMNSLKDSIYLMQNSVDDNRKNLENAKKDFITVDKLNSFKIKLADMNEDVKRFYRIEAYVKKIDERLIDKDKFEAEKEKNREAINELKNSLQVVEKISKGTVTETRLKQLAKEVSAEINEMLKKLEGFEKKGGDVADKISEKIKSDNDKRVQDLDQKFSTAAGMLKEAVEKKTLDTIDENKRLLEKERKETDRKMLKLLDGINKIREENSKLVTKNQMNEVLRRVNAEFDSVKENIEDLKIQGKDIKQLRKDKLNKASFEQSMTEISKRVADLQDETNKLREEVKIGIKVQKDFNSMMKKTVKPKQRIINILTAANIFIVLAFLLLGVSLGMYFLQMPYMNYAIIGAIVFFVAGIIIRIISVIRE
ncbi:MAG: hypothetical protein KKE20_02275 [Nanoarchaeota archaeon]|nr:hypothetical protein [Nanoarchaeota archaeon]